MTYEEVMENIGTIAKSGTAGFLEMIKQAQNAEILTPELIGQFGVGFYSAFMVADKITLVTRAAGVPKDEAVRWESNGDGSYTIETVEKDARGTTITMHLKKQEKDETDYTDQWTIRSIVSNIRTSSPTPLSWMWNKRSPFPKPNS